MTNPFLSRYWRRRTFCLALGLWPVVARASSDTTPNADALVRPGDPILGNPHGDLTLVDFYDIRCPPCRAMDVRIKRLLKTDPGIRYVPVDYPILGAASELGTKALFAAQLQGRYEALRDDFMTEPTPPDDDSIKTDAKSLGLDWSQMELDMNGDAVAARIAANLARGRALDLSGIPALFVGGIFVPGELSYDDLSSVVAMARTKKAQVKPP
ncbi:MAG: hypothetical protein B7Z75_01790 [Acidocella sp. 20-57-95]|nr:MAG: hypothetical protein B7Z75_01790 [Acidocella sp. 20-57-95]HQT63732.1 DsbA family protein [Acidocella sp.]